MKKTVNIISMFLISILMCSCYSFTLSDCYKWIDDLDFKDIKNAYIYEETGSYISLNKANSNKQTKSIYNYLKNTKLYEQDGHNLLGGTGKGIIVETKSKTYSLNFENGVFTYKNKFYTTKNKLPEINEFYCFELSYKTHELIELFSYGKFLEEVEKSFSNIRFIPESYTYIDHTSDLTMSFSNWKTITIIDENHFSYIDRIEGYKMYKLVEGYSFAEFIDKYQQEESYYTITLMDGDNKVTDIRYDKNIPIESEEILCNFANYDSYHEEHYKYLYTDKELTNEIREIKIDSDRTLYLKKGINE